MEKEKIIEELRKIYSELQGIRSYNPVKTKKSRQKIELFAVGTEWFTPDMVKCEISRILERMDNLIHKI